jgi:hypothetical protein
MYHFMKLIFYNLQDVFGCLLDQCIRCATIRLLFSDGVDPYSPRDAMTSGLIMTV